MENNTLFICQCADVHHQLIVSYDSEPDMNDSVWLQVHLTQSSFWNRLKYGIGYIFGKRAYWGDGAFAEIMLNKSKTKELIDTLTNHYEEMTDGTI